VQTSATPTRPGETRVLNLDPKDYKEVVPGKVYMRHWFGTDASVAMFRIVTWRGEKAMPCALHCTAMVPSLVCS